MEDTYTIHIHFVDGTTEKYQLSADTSEFVKHNICTSRSDVYIGFNDIHGNVTRLNSDHIIRVYWKGAE